MTTLAIPLDAWQIAYHEAMVAILRAKERVRREATFLGIAWDLWDVAGTLKHVVRLHAELHKTMTSAPRELVVPDNMLVTTISSTSDLVDGINDLLETAKRARLTNRHLTAGSLLTIRGHGEKIAEYLDALRLSVDPEVERAILQGRADFAAGRGVSLDSLLQE